MLPVSIEGRSSAAVSVREEVAGKAAAIAVEWVTDSDAEPLSPMGRSCLLNKWTKSEQSAGAKAESGYSGVRSRLIRLSRSSSDRSDSASALALSKKKDFFLSSWVLNLLLPM